jgi:hypothetical protein
VPPCRYLAVVAELSVPIRLTRWRTDASLFY